MKIKSRLVESLLSEGTRISSAALTKLKNKKSVEFKGGIAVVWSRMNRGWFVLWGKGPVEDRQLLRTISDWAELQFYLEDDLGVKE